MSSSNMLSLVLPFVLMIGLNEVKTNFYVEGNNISLIMYIAGHFNDINKEYIHISYENNIANNWAYIKDDYVIIESGPDKTRLKFTKNAIGDVVSKKEEAVAEEK